MGALVGGAPRRPRARALAAYGTALGVAFQIADDILDIEGDAAAMASPWARIAGGQGHAGLGAGHGQGPRPLGRSGGRGGRSPPPFGAKGAMLAEIARFVATREN